LSVSCGGNGGVSLGVTWPEVRGGIGGCGWLGLAAMETSGVGWEEGRSDGLATCLFVLFVRAVRLAGRLVGMLLIPCASLSVACCLSAQENEATSLGLLQQ